MLTEFLTWKTFGIAGSTIAVMGLVVAQAAAPDVSVSIGTGSVLIGGAGLVTALTAFLKPYWDDRQKQREFDERKLQFRNQRQNQFIMESHSWMMEAKAALPALPEPPAYDPIPDVDERGE